MTRILVTGAGGQLGTELVEALRVKFGNEQVIASDIKSIEETHLEAPYEQLDVLDFEALQRIVKTHQVDQIYHLAAILSAVGESKPLRAWDVNMTSLLNVLELGREQLVKRIFWPSSIAVFGPDTPAEMTPQNTVMNPNTVYGISKLAGERWCQYYYEKFGVDVRSVRYPGLIGYKAKPGGGTTDYAVEIFFKATSGEPFKCFLREGTYLPMMYMDDAIRGTIELMEAANEDISVRSSYNLAGMSFAPEEIEAEVQKHVNGFKALYEPDERQVIADSWPRSIDDSAARSDWGWSASYDLENMTKEILSSLFDQVDADQ